MYYHNKNLMKLKYLMLILHRNKQKKNKMKKTILKKSFAFKKLVKKK
jgi:hypothetical protein